MEQTPQGNFFLSLPKGHYSAWWKAYADTESGSHDELSDCAPATYFKNKNNKTNINHLCFQIIVFNTKNAHRGRVWYFNWAYNTIVEIYLV